MKKLCSLLLVLLLCVSLFTGCAVKEDPVHPPKYSMLAPLMHRPLEEFYKETGLTEETLINKGPAGYELPDTVTFRDLPFKVSLNIDPINDYFTQFYYSHVLTGTDEEKAATVLALAQYLTDALGRSQHSFAYESIATSARIAEMSVSDLVKMFSGTTLARSVGDYWALGSPDEAKIQDFKTILKEANSTALPADDAKPVIRLLLRVVHDPVQDQQTVSLEYTISYLWETVDDDFINSYYNSLPWH